MVLGNSVGDVSFDEEMPQNQPLTFKEFVGKIKNGN